MRGVRTCSDCGLTKPLADFTKPNRGMPWYHRRRKPCRARYLWEKAHPGQRYEERPTMANPGSRIPPRPVTRTCSDCGETKPIEDYVRIVASHGWYGRCRAC